MSYLQYMSMIALLTSFCTSNVYKFVLGGIYMNYPSHFVLVPSLEHAAISSIINSKTENTLMEG